MCVCVITMSIHVCACTNMFSPFVLLFQTEEFLNIFSAVGMNKLVKDMNAVKSHFVTKATSELEKCLLEK